MRRRLVDLGLTAVGAAALIGLVKALPLLAAFITLPTTWTAGQILTSGDLNAEFASILSQVNGNLDDTNIVASAAIKGSKLADSPNGITTTKLNDSVVTTGKLGDGQVTSGKLATGVSVRTSATSAGLAGEAGHTTEFTLATTAITTHGGPVVIAPSLALVVNAFTGLTTNMTLRYYRDATLLVAVNRQVTASGTGVSVEIPVDFPMIFDLAAPAGAHSYHVSAAVDSSAFGTSPNPGSLDIVELS